MTGLMRWTTRVVAAQVFKLLHRGTVIPFDAPAPNPRSMRTVRSLVGLTATTSDQQEGRITTTSIVLLQPILDIVKRLCGSHTAPPLTWCWNSECPSNFNRGVTTGRKKLCPVVTLN